MHAIFFFFATLFTAHAAEPVRFDPAYVADQDRILVDMLSTEADQFIQQSLYLAGINRTSQLQRSLEQAKVDFDRVNGLYEKGAMTREEMLTRKSEVETSQAEIEINNALTELARLRAIISKFKILQAGQTNVDYVRPVAEAQVELISSLIQLNLASQKKAQAELTLTTFLAENGAKLLPKNGISRDTYEHRLLAQRAAETRLKVTAAELTALEPALAAAKRTLERITKP